jgi:hypothetical protein
MRIEKLKKKAQKQGLNISDDALFIVRELRSELRIWGLLIVTLEIGFGIAILSLL